MLHTVRAYSSSLSSSHQCAHTGGSPCTQAKQGVVFATYELKVDSLMSLRVNYTDTLPLYTAVYDNGTLPAVISAVMFR